MTREEANATRLADSVRDVTGVFLTGGNQLRLSTVVGGTKLGQGAGRGPQARAGRRRHERGASAIASHMVAFGTSGATPKQRMTQMSAGLGLLSGVVIDQHFEQRNRIGRLIALVAQSPSPSASASTRTPPRSCRRAGCWRSSARDRSPSSTRPSSRPMPTRRSGIGRSWSAGSSSTACRRATDSTCGDAGAATLRPVDATDRQLAHIQAASDRTRKLIRRIAAEGADDSAPERLDGGPSVPEPSRKPASDARRAATEGTGPRGTFGSSSSGSTADRTTGRTSPRSSSSSTSASSRSTHQQARGLHRPPARHRAGRRRALVRDRASGRLRGPAAGRDGWATWPSTSPSSSSATRDRGRPRQDALDRPEGSLPRHLLVRRGDRRAGRRTPRRSLSSTTWSRRIRRSTSGPSSTAHPLAERAAFGPSTQAILDEAGLRDIPWIRLSEGLLVQLGHGIHQKRIRATMTSQTGALGGHRPGQEAHQPAPGRHRGAGAALRGRARGGGGGRGGGADRIPGGHEAARRQPRPRRDAQPRR